MRLCELKQKEIINICTCRSFGCPIDLEFDEKSGKITALIVPGPGRFCCFWGRDSEYVIPWNNVCQIGEDIILVDIKEEKTFRKDRLL
ncbi:MAG: YlmC/YmxH family sporulation protein [Eubacteriales bacterium]|nr:YlmC/YmxH family sporulation protein [Eubacteriales bacterium]